MRRAITLLGSTGSIGVSTLDVVRRHREAFPVFALAAGTSAVRMAEQIVEFRPAVAVMETPEARDAVADHLAERGLARADWPQLDAGNAARIRIATAAECDCVVSAIVGVPGLEATHEAARAGKRIGLANKETLVAGGKLVMDAVRESGAELIPIDSEHNGAHQCLRAGRRGEVTRLILTASGGPFRATPRAELESVTPEQALKHPTWKMGARITIDSATLMNKGFEVIEACWLFGFAPGEVDVVVHPQSSVHAMVEYNDGSVVAQLCATDMRMPIQYAMTWPERWDAPVPRMSWSEPRSFEFAPPDPDKFPCLRLSYECQRAGGSAACTLNAADEVAVAAFLARRISYPGIARVVEDTLARVPLSQPRSIGEVLEVDRLSRLAAEQSVSRRSV